MGSTTSPNSSLGEHCYRSWSPSLQRSGLRGGDRIQLSSQCPVLWPEPLGPGLLVRPAEPFTHISLGHLPDSIPTSSYIRAYRLRHWCWLKAFVVERSGVLWVCVISMFSARRGHCAPGVHHCILFVDLPTSEQLLETRGLHVISGSSWKSFCRASGCTCKIIKCFLNC